MSNKTVIFEDKFKTDMSNFKTEAEIDSFLKDEGNHVTRFTKYYPMVVTIHGNTVNLKDDDLNNKIKERILKNSTALCYMNFLRFIMSYLERNK